jgi:hypothetical protein
MRPIVGSPLDIERRLTIRVRLVRRYNLTPTGNETTIRQPCDQDPPSGHPAVGLFDDLVWRRMVQVGASGDRQTAAA